MLNQSNNNERIEVILNSLDGLQRAQPAPFFYTRLQARMTRAEKNVWEKITYFVSRPVIAFTMVSLVILINLAVLINQNGSSSSSTDQTYQSVYEDYTVASNDFYDYEIKEP